MARKENRVLGWHFVRDDWTYNNDLTGRPVQVGKVLKLPKNKSPLLCFRGFHASEKLLDALRYAPCNAFNVCRVEVWGGMMRDTDKVCGRYRKVLWKLQGDAVVKRALIRLFSKAITELGQKFSEEVFTNFGNPLGGYSLARVDLASNNIHKLLNQMSDCTSYGIANPVAVTIELLGMTRYPSFGIPKDRLESVLVGALTRAHETENGLKSTKRRKAA